MQTADARPVREVIVGAASLVDGHVEYALRVNALSTRTPPLVKTLRRRYAHFLALAAATTQARLPLPTLPRDRFASGIAKETVIRRRHLLQFFLDAVCSNPHALSHPAVRTFLELPNEDVAAALPAPALAASLFESPPAAARTHPQQQQPRPQKQPSSGDAHLALPSLPPSTPPSTPCRSLPSDAAPATSSLDRDQLLRHRRVLKAEVHSLRAQLAQARTREAALASELAELEGAGPRRSESRALSDDTERALVQCLHLRAQLASADELIAGGGKPSQLGGAASPARLAAVGLRHVSAQASAGGQAAGCGVEAGAVSLMSEMLVDAARLREALLLAGGGRGGGLGLSAELTADGGRSTSVSELLWSPGSRGGTRLSGISALASPRASDELYDGSGSGRASPRLSLGAPRRVGALSAVAT